jgi:hypothetical protein
MGQGFQFSQELTMWLHPTAKCVGRLQQDYSFTELELTLRGTGAQMNDVGSRLLLAFYVSHN